MSHILEIWALQKQLHQKVFLMGQLSIFNMFINVRPENLTICGNVKTGVSVFGK